MYRICRLYFQFNLVVEQTKKMLLRQRHCSKAIDFNIYNKNLSSALKFLPKGLSVGCTAHLAGTAGSTPTTSGESKRDLSRSRRRYAVSRRSWVILNWACTYSVCIVRGRAFNIASVLNTLHCLHFKVFSLIATNCISNCYSQTIFNTEYEYVRPIW